MPVAGNGGDSGIVGDDISCARGGGGEATVGKADGLRRCFAEFGGTVVVVKNGVAHGPRPLIGSFEFERLRVQVGNHRGVGRPGCVVGKCAVFH